MSRMTERERFLRAFHDAQPGITSRALAGTGVYERFAARVPHGRVLDLACGDGALTELVDDCVGIDVSAGELAAARRRSARAFVRGRAQALPFADGSFDAVTCQLALMLLDEIERVVAELARVLKPGAPFLALLGGGPTADGDDAFHCFATLLRDSVTQQRNATTLRFGDARASSEHGWRELFAIDKPGGWRELVFERWPIEIGGHFDDVWRFLGASYQLDELPASERLRVRDDLRAAFPGEYVPCTIACYFARVTR
jgi:SAM-dependent methyltransferase